MDKCKSCGAYHPISTLEGISSVVVTVLVAAQAEMTVARSVPLSVQLMILAAVRIPCGRRVP
jgi:hypothetical protein